MKSNLLLLALFLTTTAFNQTPPQTDLMTLLPGTWKVQNKETFEEWEMVTVNELKGKSFTKKNNEISISETLALHKNNKGILYTATVPDQNEGKSISFKLNQIDEQTYSFENPDHDFPKKIIYQFLSDQQIFVQVLGDKGKGFNFKMDKVGNNIPGWFLKDLENQIGLWETSNATFKSADEPFDKYAVEWKWGVGKTSISGRLYGMIGHEESVNFWEYKQYWDAETNQAMLFHAGFGGRNGIGTILPTDEGETTSVQTFSAPGSTPYLEKHISTLQENQLTTVSLNPDSLGDWIAKRTYIWHKKISTREVTNSVDTLPSGELMLTHEILLDAPLDKVWSAYTDPEEWKKWVTPVVEMDFKINGTIKSHYDSTATIGDKGTIVIHILSYVPKKQIVMQAELNENFPEFMIGEEKNLYSIVDFQKISANQTKLSLFGVGYKNEPKWQELLSFFIQGNEMTLNHLKEYLSQNK